MPRIPFVTLIVLLVSLSAPATSGQTPWNRQITGLALTPGAKEGTFDVHVAWSFAVAPTSVPLNLGLVLELRRNKATYAAQPHSVEVGGGSGICGPGGGCTGSCGSSTIDGLANDLFCVPDGTDCECRPLDLYAPFEGVPLESGDEIMVILYPASGALPEFETDDDQRQIVFDGYPLFWDRAVTGLQAKGAAGVYDLHIELAIYARYEGPAALPARLTVLIDGVPAGSDLSPFDDLTLAVCPFGCGGFCGKDSDGLPIGNCEIIGLPPEPWMNPPCPCYIPYGLVFPGVTLKPGDEIEIVLSPAPGALPELPIAGLLADDKLSRTFYELGDLNCDGAIDSFDIDPFVLALTDPAGYAEKYPDCDAALADVNGDGKVDAFDIDPFVALLTGG